MDGSLLLLAKYGFVAKGLKIDLASQAFALSVESSMNLRTDGPTWVRSSGQRHAMAGLLKTGPQLYPSRAIASGGNKPCST